MGFPPRLASLVLASLTCKSFGLNVYPLRPRRARLVRMLPMVSPEGVSSKLSKYQPERKRKWPRLVPANAVMVSVFLGAEQAYGLIANISKFGACVVSGVHFPPGNRVLLRIGFEPEGDPFATEADVVWTRDESEASQNPTFVHGVKFCLLSAEQVSQLAAVLSRPHFRSPVIPGKATADAGGLDAMMVELNDDLDELGRKIGREGNLSRRS